jgi:4-hydroxy-tetrahydrodipicolinate synthase
MAQKNLSGVIAAISTPVREDGAPDLDRATKLARFLLDNGCDGLNVLGTTGEATSFSLDERKSVMNAYKSAGLPMDRLMVGTGAAAVTDAIALTRHASELGFAGALVLPPFYYKGVPDDGLVAYIDAIVTATASKPVPLYLYHFPAQSGLPWHIDLIRQLLKKFPGKIVGLKDSSGDMAYARAAAAVDPSFAVFPSTEAALRSALGSLRRLHLGDCEPQSGSLRTRLAVGRRCCSRFSRRDPQAVRWQGAGVWREGAVVTYSWRCGARPRAATAGAVPGCGPRLRGRRL